MIEGSLEKKLSTGNYRNVPLLSELAGQISKVTAVYG